MKYYIFHYLINVFLWHSYFERARSCFFFIWIGRKSLTYFKFHSLMIWCNNAILMQLCAWLWEPSEKSYLVCVERQENLIPFRGSHSSISEWVMNAWIISIETQTTAEIESIVIRNSFFRRIISKPICLSYLSSTFVFNRFLKSYYCKEFTLSSECISR